MKKKLFLLYLIFVNSKFFLGWLTGSTCLLQNIAKENFFLFENAILKLLLLRLYFK